MKDIATNSDAPEWLTKTYMELVMRKYKQDDTLEIIKLNTEPATAKGDNYASIMTRIKIEYSFSNCKNIHRESYIVKSSHESNPYLVSVFEPYDCYRTEMQMYEKVLPKLTELLQQVDNDDKLFANTVHVDYEHTAIIFEDLSVSSFGVGDRLIGMDEDFIKLALKKLAKMHAAAAVLNERETGSLEKFNHGIFNRHTRGFGVFFEYMLEICAEFAGDCDELGKYYQDKLLKLKSKFVEYGTRVYDRHDGHFITLNHGDFWINNIMIRYNDSNNNNNKVVDIKPKTIKDIILIDFQFCSWASPAVDLHYLFNTSLQNDFRLHHQDELFHYYHNVLVHTLKELKYNGHIPTLHQFCIQMEEGRFFAVTSALVNQPMMINDNTENADVECFFLNDERSRSFRKQLYKNKVVQNYMKVLLPVFDRRGLLDVVD